MLKDSERPILIAGAGLAGSLLACFLAKRGFRVEVFERRPDPRRSGFVGGRSINLALSTRGIDALQRVGLAADVLRDAVPMRGRMMHSPAGDLAFQRYSKNESDAINSVSRGGLNITLLDAAEQYDTVRLHFGQRCAAVDLDGPSLTTVDSETGERTEHRGQLLIGADGAFSVVRNRMQKSDRFNYSQQYLEHGYKELSIPPTADGEFAMEPNALHIWPRGGYMMIALPNRDRTFTCTLFWPFEGPHGFAALNSDAEILDYFNAQFGDAVPLMPTLVHDFQTNPTSSLVTVRCEPWHCGDSVVLVGDAAHAIVPFYGQGMNAGFEDCVVFDEHVGRLGADWAKLLPAYSAARKPNGDAIADLALENFIEMRDKVSSRAFRARKKMETMLHRLLPRWYMPLYNMVTFSTIPYEETRRRAARQARTVVACLSGVGVVGLAAIIILLSRFV